MHLTQIYDLWLVAISAAIAVVASYAALDLSSRIYPSKGWSRWGWGVSSGVAFGFGAWATHFVATLAMNLSPKGRPDLDLPFSYSPTYTALSLFLAVALGGVALATAARSWPIRNRILICGLLAGAGITASHYTGMAAIRGPLRLEYHPIGVVSSILLAVALSTGALWVRRSDFKTSRHLLAAALLGVAMLGTHTIDVLQVDFVLESSDSAIRPVENLPQASIALIVALISLFLVVAALLAANLDRRVKESWAISSRNLKEMLDQIPWGVIVAEAPSGVIEMVNKAAERKLGHSVPLGVGPDDYDVSRVVLESGEPFPGRDFPLVRACRGETVEAQRIHYARDDGRTVVLELKASPVFGAQGEITHGLAVFRDITDMVATERALRESQKMEAIGRLTGGVAHDFNNLLTVIVSSAELAMTHIENPRKLRGYLEGILSASERGATLTARLLAFARRQPLHPQIVDPAHALVEIVAMLGSTLGREIELESEIPDSLPLVRIDPDNLQNALLNLAFNSRDAMPNGGRLSVRARAGAEYVTILVEDSGTGIPEELLNKAVEPFFTTKEVGKGSGLGLSHAYGFAQQSGGSLSIRSRVGQGTTVEIRLPIAPNLESSSGESKPKPLDLKGPRGTVLLVDDQQEVAKVTVEVLQHNGFHSTHVTSPARALEMLQAGWRFDVLLTNMTIPGGTSGADLARIVCERWPSLPVVIVSGYPQHAEEQAPEGPMILSKPFKSDELISTLSRAIRGRKRA